MHDPWITLTPLEYWPTYINMDADLTSMKVNQLLSPTHIWNADTLATIFSDDLIKLINKVPVAHGLWPDSIAWKTRANHVTLKDILQTMHDTVTTATDRSFYWIWKLQIPMRVKTFLWKLVWRRISCKELLYKRHIIPTNIQYCDLCLTEIEDCHHIMVGCSFAKQCWEYIEAVSFCDQAFFFDWFRKYFGYFCGW